MNTRASATKMQNSRFPGIIVRGNEKNLTLEDQWQVVNDPDNVMAALKCTQRRQAMRVLKGDKRSIPWNMRA